MDRALVGGEVLPGDGHVVAAPGHTPGSLVLYLPGPGVLFAGDPLTEDAATLLRAAAS